MSLSSALNMSFLQFFVPICSTGNWVASSWCTSLYSHSPKKGKPCALLSVFITKFWNFLNPIINRWPFHLDPVKSFSTPSFIKENFYSSIKFYNWHFFHIGIISGVHPYIPCHTLHSRQKIMCTIEILPDLTFGSVLKISRYEIMCTKINTWNHSISNFSWKICVKPLQNVSLRGESSVILVSYTVNSFLSRRHLWDLHFVSI